MYKISEEQVKALLNYLAAKPFAEVHEGIKMLQSLEKVEEVNSKEE
jgi:hypothetical protein